MYIRLAALSLLIGVIALLYRRFRPTVFGLGFGLLLIYVPVLRRQPFDLLPGINGLTIALFCLAALLAFSVPRLGPSTRGFVSLVGAFLGFSFVGFVAGLGGSADVATTTTLFKRWLDPALFGLLALGLARDGDRRFTVSCIGIGYCMVAIQAARQGLDYGPLKRIPGLLNQPNETGAFLAMYTPVVLALALLYTGWQLRVILLGAVALAGGGLIALESRGAMIGFAVAIFLMLFASRRPVLASTGLAVMLVVVAFPEVLPERLVARFQQTVIQTSQQAPPGQEEALEEKLEISAALRIQQWKASVDAMLANPVGFGFDQYRRVIAGFGGVKGLDAHNFFFLVGVELGWIGLALLLAIFAMMGWNAWALAQSAPDPFLRSLGIGAAVMVVAAAIVNIFGTRLMQEAPSTYFWVLGGILAAGRDRVLAYRPVRRTAPAAPGAGRAWWAR